MESLQSWLAKHRLDELLSTLVEQDIDLDVIGDLTESDMAELGLTLGQRKRLLRAARDTAIADMSETAGKAMAERRQLTVMFCDMVGSTPMAVDLELEDYREAIRDYQSGVGEILQRNNAFIARYMGDGVLAYFGYPMASEDDAIRAVSAGLQLVSLFFESENFRARGLKVRIGIATGMVVAGDIIGSGSAEQHAVLGDTPNLAARLQSVAQPNQLVVDNSTWQLTDNAFTARRIDNLSLKGFAHALTAWQVLSDRSADESPARMTKLVGRDGDLKTLAGLWEQTQQGQLDTCVISGDPGIGKSRLLSAFIQSCGSQAQAVIQLRGSNYASNSVFHPLNDFLAKQLVEHTANESSTPLESFHALVSAVGLEPDQCTVFADLLGVQQPPDSQVAVQPQHRHELLIHALLDIIGSTINGKLSLLVVEDLHLFDPSSIQLLRALTDSFGDQSLLLVASCRTGFDTTAVFGFEPVSIVLSRLDNSVCRDLINSIGPLPEQVVDEVLDKGDGVPLFIEEITKALLQSGIPDNAGRLSVPSTLQSLLMAKLDRLGPHKYLAQVSAVVGRDISIELLELVVSIPRVALHEGLQVLVSAGILMSITETASTRYVFCHALVQDLAYQSVLRDERRLLHLEVANALRNNLPELAVQAPERVAWHLTAAASATSEDAIKYWQLAAIRAADLAAYTECIAHIDAGLKLLLNVEHSRLRDEREVELLTLLASVYRGTKGLAADEIEETYLKTLVLAEKLDLDDALIPALNGLYSFNLMRANNRKALEYASRLLEKATQTGEKTYRMIGHRALGAVSFHTGQLDAAESNLKESLSLYDDKVHHRSAWQIGTDHHTVATSFLSLTQWLSGRPVSAVAAQKQAALRAVDLGHHLNMAQAQVFLAFISALDEHTDAWQIAETLFISARENGFPMMSGAGQFFMGSAMVAAGDHRDGREQMLQGAKAWWATGTTNYRPYGEMRIAEAHLLLGDTDAARTWLDTAADRLERYSEHWCEPEMYRLKSLLQMALDGDSNKARACLDIGLGRAIELGTLTWLPRMLIRARSDRDERNGDDGQGPTTNNDSTVSNAAKAAGLIASYPELLSAT